MTTVSLQGSAEAPVQGAFRAARDAHDRDIDLKPIQPLLDRIVALWGTQVPGPRSSPLRTECYVSGTRGSVQPLCAPTRLPRQGLTPPGTPKGRPRVVALLGGLAQRRCARAVALCSDRSAWRMPARTRRGEKRRSATDWHVARSQRFSRVPRWATRRSAIEHDHDGLQGDPRTADTDHSLLIERERRGPCIKREHGPRIARREALRQSSTPCR